jgi:hypothetical protein
MILGFVHRPYGEDPKRNQRTADNSLTSLACEYLLTSTDRDQKQKCCNANDGGSVYFSVVVAPRVIHEQKTRTREIHNGHNEG